MANDDFVPYANESEVLRIGGLEIENRVDRVTLTGDLVLTKDRAGLALVQELQALLGRIQGQLQADAALPDTVVLQPTKTVRNPFA
jgi:hypothetical protein